MPSLVAVIGHRDLRREDFPFIERAVEEWWTKQAKRFKDGRGVLLTSLAPGADQLAAWVVARSDGAGAPDIQPVWPYREADYANDVREQESRYQPPDCKWSFDSLEQQINSGANSSRRSSTTRPEDSDDRNLCYRRTARRMAEEADILIALWDGVHEGQKVGGTSDSLRYALSSKCQEERRRRDLEPLEVHWLVVPRTANARPAGEAFTWVELPAASPARPSHHPWRNRPAAISLFLAVVSVALSSAGYSQTIPTEDGPQTLSDVFLVALSHLTWNGLDSSSDGRLAWLIRAGRWTAVLFGLATIASIMNAVFRSWDSFRLIRTTQYRIHDIVWGLGTTGQRLLRENDHDALTTVAVDRSDSEASRAFCAELAVPLLKGDPGTPDTIRRSGLDKAQTVFVATDSDETNLQVARLLNAASPHSDLVCCVEMQSPHYAAILSRLTPQPSGLDLRIFNTNIVTARMLFAAHPVDRFRLAGKTDSAHVILVGDSSMAQALLRQVLEQGIFEFSRRLHVSWLCPDADHALRDFTDRFPVYTRTTQPMPPPLRDMGVATPPGVWGGSDEGNNVLPDIHFLSLPSSDRGLLEAFEEKEYGLLKDASCVTTLVVAYPDPSMSVSALFSLGQLLSDHRSGEQADINVLLYYAVADEDHRQSVDAALNDRFPLLPIHLFSDFLGWPWKSSVRGDDIDAVARRVNGIHNKLDKDSQDFEDRCRAKWRQASEDNKWSSRQAAAHTWTKRRIAARLRAAGTHDEATIRQDLADIEHRRWCAEYLLNGFRSLTRIPSENPSFKRTKSEDGNIRDWFGNEATKNAFKSRRFHVDLVPSKDFERLFDAHRCAEEHAKDLDQIDSLDQLIDGAAS